MNSWGQFALAAAALVIMGALAVALIFRAVPEDNRELVSTIIGAIAGALTMSGVQRTLHPPAGNPADPQP